ncbi:solute carrier family 22 member 4-like isoform X1 [Saccostrea echinata]|uniref:solute carrier family 22 member 4-like isoform X1 n=1 Tax=Saccostrea echinata TaxID=191078 RepID=UPI002A7FAD4D|nr:solute carrier family 22 member 4-like isoform X1 [Saccostrea echinata]
MKTVSEYLENVLEETGGFGKFQILLHGSILFSKVSITWSLLIMAFAGASPDWWCVYSNTTDVPSTINYSIIANTTMTSPVHDVIQAYKTCTPSSNASVCQAFIFDDSMKTIINEWGLICDKKWVTATVSSVQMAGLLISGFLGGQLADLLGRKPTFFVSLFILSASNIVAGFSQSWVMFAVTRFIIGLGCGAYLTVFYTFSVEFTPTKFRPIQLAVPDWSIWAALLGLCSYLLKDWRSLHILTGVLTGISLFSWWIVPESFRWLVSHDKLTEADRVIKKIARINNHPKPELNKLQNVVESDATFQGDRKYTFLELFRNRTLLINTALAGVAWFSSGYAYYAISYSVDQLSGNLYLNMFLLSVIDIPALMSIWYLSNRIGRRWTCLGYFVIGSLACLGVAVSQMIDVDKELQKSLINGFALAAKLGVSASWAAIMAFTTEVYPTVVRNIGYGTQNSISRIGALIAPQFVLLNKETPGVMYIICFVVSLISAIMCLLLKETKDKTIGDNLEVSVKQRSGSRV